jgi:hypothetical protein
MISVHTFNAKKKSVAGKFLHLNERIKLEEAVDKREKERIIS